MNHPVRLLAVGCVLALAAPPQEAVRAQQAGGDQKSPSPLVSSAVNFAHSARVRDLPPSNVPAGQPGRIEGEDRPQRIIKNPILPKRNAIGASDEGLDLAVQSEAPLPNTPGPIVSFDGISNADNFAAFGFRVVPPDTNGDVGPNHYVQQVNLLVRVWNKTGVPLTAPFKLSSLFAPLGGQCAAPDNGDPVALYDPLADRWLLSQFAFASLSTPPYHQCIAISKTPDPTGAYFLYDFVTPGSNFPDYPHLGVWPDGYYMTVNQFLSGGPFNGTGFYAFNREKMLAGDPTASFIYFNFDLASHPEGVGGALPSDLDGLNTPPVGAPNVFSYFLATEFGDAVDGLRLFNFHADFAVPASSTLTERPESPVFTAPFDPRDPAGRNDLEQPAPATSSNYLDSIQDRLMHRLQYRNFGTHESLVGTHTVNVGPSPTTTTGHQAAPRYFELRRSGGAFSFNEQATFAPDTDNRWMGSAAMDNQGDLAVGYSVSSLTTFPSIRYAGRLASDPPGGLFQGENTLVAGSGVQRSTSGRWGDYSMLAVDPADDCTFWYTQEYYTLASQGTSTIGWVTRIGSFKFPTCTAPAKGQLTVSVTDCVTLAPMAGASIRINGALYGSTGASGSFSTSLPPGTYTVVASKAGATASGTAVVTDGGSTTLSLCLGGGGGGGTAVFDPTLMAPKCGTVGSSCDSGTLLTGRDGMGPEPNQPNTIGGSCSDGTTGTFHSDESNDRIKVSTTDGTDFATGKTVKIDATVWAWTNPSADRLDLYFAADATSPSWTFITTLTPTVAGAQTLSATFTLPAGSLQAVRARFRYGGAPAACGPGPYNDHDDLIFAVTSGGGGGGTAVFDPTLMVPKCGTVGSSCDSSTLLTGRDGKGPEPNQPNTIGGSCSDGTSGTFHSDESNDRIKVSTTDGTDFATGKTVKIDATVWAWTNPSADHLDLYFAADATSPSWTFITTLTATVAGAQTLSATFTLPAGSLQAVRARFRYGGAPAACGPGAYNDHDDLAFAVTPGGGGGETAVFDPTLMAPKCGTIGSSCDSASLLTGRDGVGPEPNQPNTIGDSCADGTTGTFHSDESNDRIKVSTTDGTNFAAGKTVKIDATVWAWANPSADQLDLYYAADASSPVWTYITTLTPTVAGAQTLSATYTLPAGSLQAVRARFRYGGAPAACGPGAYNDHDDLIFAVGP